MSHYSCEAHHWPQTEPSLRCGRAGKNRYMPCKLCAWRPISPSEHKVQVERLLIASSNAEPAAFGQRCTVSNTQCCCFRRAILNISKHSISLPEKRHTVFYKSPECHFWIKPCTLRLVSVSLSYLWNKQGIWMCLPSPQSCAQSGDTGALPESQTSGYTACTHDWCLPLQGSNDTTC